MSNESKPLLARALASEKGKTYWRGVSELQGTPEFVDSTLGEFPVGADKTEGINRRDFVKLMGASVALAGLEGCTQPPAQKVFAYNDRPGEVTPGLPLYFATSMVHEGYAFGLLARSNEGRPTKVEGNSEHSSSLGKTSVREQASVLDLYDPYRSGSLTWNGEPSSWERAFEEVLRPRNTKTVLRFLLPPTSSPQLASMVEKIKAKFPDTKFTFYAPLARTNVFKGARLAFGKSVETHYAFDKAKVVVSLDADFTNGMPNSVRWAHDFASGRKVSSQKDASVNRLYVAETMLSPTGILADHRLRLRSSEIAAATAALLAEVQKSGVSSPELTAEMTSAVKPWSDALPASARTWVEAAARDLKKNAGNSIVVAGERQREEVHALVHLLNLALGNVGKTVQFTETALLEGGLEGHPLSELLGEMKDGKVDTLFISGSNPVYECVGDGKFAEALKTVKNSVYYGAYENETSRHCTWFLPGSHYLETWGDARAFDGTISLIQPLINPIFDTKSLPEVLSNFTGETVYKSGHKLLKGFWQGEKGKSEGDWEEAVRKGFFAGTAFAPMVVPGELSFQTSEVQVAAAKAAATGAPANGLELNLVASPSIYDGRSANNIWLQELPEPASKLTWDNAAFMSLKTAKELGVSLEDLVELKIQDKTVRVAAYPLPGHADNSVTLHFGYGRDAGRAASTPEIAEKIALGVGVNAFSLRGIETPYIATGLNVSAVGEKYKLAITQTHWSINKVDGHGEPKWDVQSGWSRKPLVMSATLEEYKASKDFLKEHKLEAYADASLFPKSENEWDAKYGVPKGVPPVKGMFGTEQWAMTIDTSVCTGCNACVIACQAENNIAVVGKDGVRRSREMQWLRIDRYFVSTEGQEDDPEVLVQPMMCQHCEKAPCEYVCPVNATVHSSDGLNEMIYNRCIGTRFCSNNCPYKARRFNFFDYSDSSMVKLVRNPDVTVRERGVMEKCTYCVQRVRAADIRAQVEGREIGVDEVVTACQQACPTGAITFGSLRHEDSEFFKFRNQPRNYVVLNDQGTRPRTQYLAKITDPNPELAPKAPAHSGEHHE